MNLQRMSDEAIAAELLQQQRIQNKYPPTSQMWITAARIIHHLSSEQERRAVAHVPNNEKQQPTQ
jgi:hypothetical protein